MIINGIELEYDAYDADQIETVQQGLEKVAKIQDMDFTGMSDADGIRAMCTVVNQFFDAVFGEETAEKLFQGRSSMTKCMEAMESFLLQKDSQEKAMQDRYSAQALKAKGRTKKQ